MNSKRGHEGSTGDTPGKPKTKAPKIKRGQPVRKTLFGKGHVVREEEGRKNWEHKEIAALVQFIGLYWNNAHSDGWPNTHDINFWDSCRDAVAEVTGLPKRSGIYVICIPSELSQYLLVGFHGQVQGSPD